MEAAFYKNLLDALSDGIYFVDTDRRVTFWNKAAERLTGFAAEEIVGRSCSENLLRHVDEHGRQLCRIGCPLTLTMSDGVGREALVYLHHKQGHRVPVRVKASPMRDDQGVIVGAVEVFSPAVKDADALKEMEELRQEVLTDGLTGIANRRYADIAMERLDSVMRDSQSRLGVMFIDLDRFKQVNDTWGHAVGDRVLGMVARTLEASLRPMDVLCRWGGEEFVVLVPNSSVEGLSALARRMQMLLSQSWVEHEGNRVEVTASFGLALSGSGETASQVVERADREVYLSKRSGRDCISMDGVCLLEE